MLIGLSEVEKIMFQTCFEHIVRDHFYVVRYSDDRKLWLAGNVRKWIEASICTSTVTDALAIFNIRSPACVNPCSTQKNEQTTMP
jgi:hypothetical protein